MIYSSPSPWLFGFDFDGTLANSTQNHRVSSAFFETIQALKEKQRLVWGICTGRSLPFAIEGMENAHFPIKPDFLVTREREIFYSGDQDSFVADESWNQRALSEVHTLLERNAATLQTAKRYISEHTTGQWVSQPEDPAGIIADCPTQIEHVVALFEACQARCEHLDYQRNSIYLRYSHKQFSKGTAVQKLQKHYQISPQQTLVMGDNYNDLSMLQPHVASYFGSPSNGIACVQEHLDQVGGFVTTSPYAEGVVEAISQLPIER